ncbi:MAG: ATP-binding protein [Candidatus Omnitrophica bacterium]|jgi:signal transduction histidine kinase|nr:ATP-binding protein [Candidatus Omnitrophota bacterium]
MRIQTKLLILTIISLCFFVVTFLLFMRLEESRLNTTLQQAEKEEYVILDKLLNLKGLSLLTLANDYSYWDEMVSFVSTKDKKWAKANMETALVTFQVNAEWVYDIDFNFVYAFSDTAGKKLEKLPLSKDDMRKLFSQSRFCNFFINTPSGLMEIRGATVHPTLDVKRLTIPQGYFFVGRLWDKEFLSELSDLMGGSLTLLPYFGEKLKASSKIVSEKGVLHLSRALNDFNDQPLMMINISIESETVQTLKRASPKIIFTITSIIIFAFLIMIFLLNHWVNIPLQQIAKTLSTGELSHIRLLEKDRAEFGDISRLIVGFFNQKEALVKEISERKKVQEEINKANVQLTEAQDQLIQAEKLNAVGQLASGVAHEVRNPLGIIVQGVNFLEKKVPVDGKDIAEVLAMIKDSVKRADAIVASLLDFSRAANLGLQPENIDSIISDSLNLIKNQPELKAIAIDNQVPSGLAKVLVDKNKLEQVFINILLNAIQAMPNGGKLVIRGYEKQLNEIRHGIGNRENDHFKLGEKAVVVEFEDTGVGIPEEYLDRVFDPFFTTKGPRGGSGLGLSVSRNIMHRHKGLIYLSSQPGKGTIITIILKLSKR